MPGARSDLDRSPVFGGSPSPGQIGAAIRPLLVVAGYLATFVVLEFASRRLEAPPGISGLYPRAGLNLALLFGLGLAYAPAVFLGSLISGFWIYRLPISPLAAVALAAVTTLGYTLAAAILKYLLKADPQLRRLRDVLWFVLVGFIGAYFVGNSGALVFVRSGLIPRSDFLPAAVKWFVSDAVGLMILTPFLLVCGRLWARRLYGERKDAGEGEATQPAERLRPSSRRAILENIAQGFSIVFVLWLVFGTQFSRHHHLFYFCLLPLVWIALRHGLRGAAASILAINVGAMLVVWAFHVQLRDPVESQILMLALAVTGLLLGSVVSER